MEDVNQTKMELQISQVYEQLDLSRWMENLPGRLLHIPLHHLAIPGSHDSFTFFLDRSGCVSPDEPEWMKRWAEYLGLGCCVKRIIYNWSSVQSLNVTEQLSAGIRYFDIRIATKNEHKDTNLFCVHGLYGRRIDECLRDIASYLEEHRREIVILDFNHFYEVSCEAHHCLIGKIRERFGSKLCPVHHDLRDVSLKFMWDKGYQVIVLYNNCLTQHFQFLWPGCCVDSCWPNTDQVDQLIDTLEQNYERGRPDERFYVTQGVLTPGEMFIVCHFYSTLKRTLAQTAVGPFLNWVQSKAIGRNGLNICIIDCIELGGFTKAVVCLNYRQRDTTASSSITVGSASVGV